MAMSLHLYSNDVVYTPTAILFRDLMTHILVRMDRDSLCEAEVINTIAASIDELTPSFIAAHPRTKFRSDGKRVPSVQRKDYCLL